MLQLDHLKHAPSDSLVARLAQELDQVLPCSPQPGLIQLPNFIAQLSKLGKLDAGTLVYALILLRRLSHRLPPHARGMACTRHRIVTSCFMLSNKCINDMPLRNKHWVKICAAEGIMSWGLGEINLMEKQLLFLLDFKLFVSAEEYHGYVANLYPGSPTSPLSAATLHDSPKQLTMQTYAKYNKTEKDTKTQEKLFKDPKSVISPFNRPMQPVLTHANNVVKEMMELDRVRGGIARLEL